MSPLPYPQAKERPCGPFFFVRLPKGRPSKDGSPFAQKDTRRRAGILFYISNAAVALLAVLGPFDVLRSVSSLHVIIALAAAMMTGGVLDLVFWVLDPFGWKNEG